MRIIPGYLDVEPLGIVFAGEILEGILNLLRNISSVTLHGKYWFSTQKNVKMY